MLSFDYHKRNIPHKRSFNKHPSFMDDLPYKLIDTYNDEYDDRDNFGSEVNDDNRALFHATANLRWLEKNWNNGSNHSLKKAYDSHLGSLKQDFKNYFKCVTYYQKGCKAILRQFTEAMLAYGLTDTVLLAVEIYLADVIRSEISTDSIEKYLPDYYELYLKAADIELFYGDNPYIVKRCYDIITIMSSLNCKFDKNYNKNDAIIKEKIDNSVIFNIYNDIINENSVKNKLRNDLRDKYKDVVDSFNILIDYELSYNNIDSICYVSDYVFSTFKNHLKKNSDTDSCRLIALMSNVIYSKYLLILLYKLSFCSYKIKSDFASRGIRKIKYVRDEQLLNLKKFCDNAIKFNKKNEYFNILSYLAIYLLSRFVMNDLHTDDNIGEVCYYTSFDNFSFMLPYKCKDDSKNEVGKLTVMNLSYMNDPNEGLILKKILFGDDYKQVKYGRKTANVQYVFVKCFSPLKDYLPMWNMYGDNAEGLCIIINWKETIKRASVYDSPLYNVCYIRHKGQRFWINEGDNPNLSSGKRRELYQCIVEIRGIIKSNKLDDSIIADIIGDATFLFKDASYSYEMEQRILYSYKKVNDSFLHTKAEMPLVYIQPNFTLQIKEIILGPRFKESYVKLPFIKEQIDVMCQKIHRDIPDITLSNIEYR